ncbi:unnamed protein product [Urochloa humidicola]
MEFLYHSATSATVANVAPSAAAPRCVCNIGVTEKNEDSNIKNQKSTEGNPNHEIGADNKRINKESNRPSKACQRK